MLTFRGAEQECCLQFEAMERLKDRTDRYVGMCQLPHFLGVGLHEKKNNKQMCIAFQFVCRNRGLVTHHRKFGIATADLVVTEDLVVATEDLETVVLAAVAVVLNPKSACIFSPAQPITSSSKTSSTSRSLIPMVSPTNLWSVY